jgi:hypothetical protein
MPVHIPDYDRMLRSAMREFRREIEKTVFRKFIRTLPRWAPTLPLTEQDCVELCNQRNHRLFTVGRYGSYLRRLRWRLENAQPFEIFSSQVLAARADGCGREEAT